MPFSNSSLKKKLLPNTFLYFSNGGLRGAGSQPGKTPAKEAPAAAAQQAMSGPKLVGRRGGVGVYYAIVILGFQGNSSASA